MTKASFDRSMLKTGGGPPRPPPSPGKEAIIDMFGNTHAFNGVVDGVESAVFTPSQSSSLRESEDAAAGALLSLGSREHGRRRR